MAAAAQVNRYHPVQLVDGDGNFSANIEQDLDLAHENCPIGAVSIMGVQSSGKSTLLNKCFSTNFQEMDQSQGMSQTTKGIWIAKWPSPDGGLKILVLDTEGSDGSERGLEDDDTFEKKIALFALTMSNTLIFNMKCDNVDLHRGSSMPLLKTVLQVMLRKFSTPRRVNLLFVLRDKNMCPLDWLRSQLIRRAQEIWQGLCRTQSNVNAALENYFNIEVMVMSHYRHERQEFDREVGYLRERVITLVQHGQPASSFVALAKKNWNDIKEDKILNLQLNEVKPQLLSTTNWLKRWTTGLMLKTGLKIMITVDGSICHQISAKKSKNFRTVDKTWDQIKRDVKSGNIIEGFGNDVSAIIRNYLSEYDEETLDFDESKRSEHRKELIERMLEDVERIHLTLVENMRNAKLETFQEALVQKIKGGCPELVSMNREELITEFTDLLEDANIKQANWNHPHEQLEKLKSELVSYEEGARSIVLILKQLKRKKTLLRTGVAALWFTTLACCVVVDFGLFTLPALAASAAGAMTPAVITLPSFTSLSNIIAEATNSKQIEQELNEASLRNPAVGALWKRLDRP